MLCFCLGRRNLGISPPGSAIFSSGFPSTSKFGHGFLPESVGGVLGAVVFPWEGIFGNNFNPATGGVSSLRAGTYSGGSVEDLSLASISDYTSVGDV